MQEMRTDTRSKALVVSRTGHRWRGQFLQADSKQVYSQFFFISLHVEKCKDRHIYGIFVSILFQVTDKEIFRQYFFGYFPNVRQTVTAFDCCVRDVNEKQAAIVRFDWPTLGAITWCSVQVGFTTTFFSVSRSLISWTLPNGTKHTDGRLSICIHRSTSCYIREMVDQV